MLTDRILPRAPAMAAALLALCWVGAALPASSATLHVEKDGSGEFTEIQPALDAAQPGDTVRIGPGRYDTFAVHTLGAGGTLQVVGLIDTAGIVVEGVDRGSVLVGPENQVDEIDGIQTIGLSVDLQATDVTIRNLTAVNTFAGVGTTADRTTFESVTVHTLGQTGLQSWATDGLVIRDCAFSGADFHNVWIVAQAPSRNVLIEDCIIESDGDAHGIDVGSAPNVTVRRCSFSLTHRLAVSVVIWSGASGVIENCTFETTGGGVHTVVSSGVDVHMHRNVLNAGATESLRINGGRVTGTGNYFGGGTFATLNVAGRGGSATLQNGTIGHLGEYSALVTIEYGFGPDHVDLRNNFWESTDSTEIAEWIYDGTDPGGELFVPVLFTPFLNQSVATDRPSFGSFKALFAEPK